ncbi:Wadjet anti-phage system protein JetD domain-containing protein [Kribbella sp. CA-294648]|uniref:Wadjet anti-phage system protein JetD domain-containing protein n=1 Tax=Kribbella sp. CA-294648 TaxID=3239948 RepID=UPI003D8BF927
MTSWTSVSDIRARVLRRWNDGTLLRALAAGEPFPVIDIALRGPRPAQIGDDIGSVQAWIAALDAGRRGDTHYTLKYVPIGGRLIGRNELPARAQVTSYQQAWSLLGVSGKAKEYAEIVSLTAQEPVVNSWVARHPLRALELGPDWPTLLSAYRWLAAAKGSARYLREISAPGVDTKFVERHRAILAQLLDVPTSSSGFLAGLGLRAKPEMLRLRPAPELGLASPFSEASVRLAELAQLSLDVRTAVIVENEITFLSVPVPAGGIVLWGKGFEVNRPGSLPWLRAAEVLYWGDLDTHGFAILNQLRAWLPQTRSFLMDRNTFLAHRERWGSEPSPTAAHLARLTTEEMALYSDLVTARFGERIRLEQERIDWAWAQERFDYR